MRISSHSGPNPGGGMPSLSQDGARLAFIANARVMVSETNRLFLPCARREGGDGP